MTDTKPKGAPRGAAFGPGFHPDRFRPAFRVAEAWQHDVVKGAVHQTDPEADPCGCFLRADGRYAEAYRCSGCGMYFDVGRPFEQILTPEGESGLIVQALPVANAPVVQALPEWQAEAARLMPSGTDPALAVKLLRDLLGGMGSGLTPQDVARIAGDVMVRGAAEGAFRHVIEIKRQDAPTIALDGTAHKLLPEVIQTAAIRRPTRGRFNVLLVGPKGCGKTHMARQVADALGLPFGAFSCSLGTTDGEIIGRVIPNITGGTAHLQRSVYLRMYAEGGVCLGDELDALNPAVGLRLNMGLDSTEMYDGLGNPVTRHPDFIFIGSMNTWGHGASREYCGREMQDTALLDRFSGAEFELDYDRDLEKALCPDNDLRGRLWKIRERAVELRLMKRVPSTRRIGIGYELKHSLGLTTHETLLRLTAGWGADREAVGVTA